MGKDNLNWEGRQKEQKTKLPNSLVHKGDSEGDPFASIFIKH